MLLIRNLTPSETSRFCRLERDIHTYIHTYIHAWKPKHTYMLAYCLAFHKYPPSRFSKKYLKHQILNIFRSESDAHWNIHAWGLQTYTLESSNFKHAYTLENWSIHTYTLEAFKHSYTLDGSKHTYIHTRSWALNRHTYIHARGCFQQASGRWKNQVSSKFSRML